MRVMIGCEESQTVCAAFRAAGHEAYSCDLIETRGNPDWHIQGDIMDVLGDTDMRRIDLQGGGCLFSVQWDLIILHPVCTAMALSGNGTYGKNKDGTPKDKHYLRVEAVEWTVNLWNEAIKRCDKVAMENPKSVLFPKLRKLGAIIQYVQPWMFGHKENKETGFALHGLPKLEETSNVKKLVDLMPKSETDKVHRMAPGPNRSRDRSKTYDGIAQAMVIQWAK